MYTNLAVVWPDFEHIVQTRRGFRPGINWGAERASARNKQVAGRVQIAHDISSIFVYVSM